MKSEIAGNKKRKFRKTESVMLSGCVLEKFMYPHNTACFLEFFISLNSGDDEFDKTQFTWLIYSPSDRFGLASDGRYFC